MIKADVKFYKMFTTISLLVYLRLVQMFDVCLAVSHLHSTILLTGLAYMSDTTALLRLGYKIATTE